MELNYKRIWKKENLKDKILATIILRKRKICSKIFYFKKDYCYHILNRLEMIGLTKEQKAEIVMLRQHYRHKAKVISKKMGISKNKVWAVLYYYNCWKIKPYKDLFYMNITRDSYSWLR